MARLLDSIFGHDAQKKLFREAIRRERFPSAVIFSGAEGIGKKRMATALVQELNCAQRPACGSCEPCLKMTQNTDVFLQIVDLQNDKIKIEAIRDILQFSSLKSWVTHRFVIINQIEKITIQAANALLKTLEEPPPGLHFILITSNLSQVLPTLRSRCQVVHFSPLAEGELQKIVPDLQPWQMRWSFGRASLAQKVVSDEWQTIRKAAINFLHSPQTPAIYEEVQGYLGTADTADFVIHSWMTYLCDSLRLQAGSSESTYNVDVLPFLEKFAAQRNIPHLMDQVLQFRQDLSANVDRSLLLDQWGYQL